MQGHLTADADILRMQARDQLLLLCTDTYKETGYQVMHDYCSCITTSFKFCLDGPFQLDVTTDFYENVN